MEDDIIMEMSKDIPGIKDKSNYGDINELVKGKLYDFIVQKHIAEKAGPHRDIRIGDKDLGLFSFATKKDFPLKDKEKITLFQQPLHDYSYKDFQGNIDSGYGAGDVSKESEGKVLITNVKPTHISFSLADSQTPQRYSLIRTKEDKNWLLIKHTNPTATGHKKVKYKIVPKDKMFEHLETLKPGDLVTPKIDGALSLILLNNNIEALSHRLSKKTNLPIVHTEKFLREKVKVPIQHQDSLLLGEMYGLQGSKVIHPSTLSGILNSGISKSLDTQDKEKIKLKTMLFDVVKYKGSKELGTYKERLALLKNIIKDLPAKRFELPEIADNKEDAIKMLKAILAKKHPLTAEGVVIHHETGDPTKLKIVEEHNVFIKDIFEGEKKYKGKAAGGFHYSWTPGGAVIGAVGTGLDDLTRKDMYEHPDNYIGRVARVYALERNKNDVLQKPSYIGLDESK